MVPDKGLQQGLDFAPRARRPEPGPQP